MTKRFSTWLTVSGVLLLTGYIMALAAARPAAEPADQGEEKPVTATKPPKPDHVPAAPAASIIVAPPPQPLPELEQGELEHGTVTMQVVSMMVSKSGSSVIMNSHPSTRVGNKYIKPAGAQTVLVPVELWKQAGSPHRGDLKGKRIKATGVWFMPEFKADKPDTMRASTFEVLPQDNNAKVLNGSN